MILMKAILLKKIEFIRKISDLLEDIVFKEKEITKIIEEIEIEKNF